MINLNNLKPVKNGPSPLFLHGGDLLDKYTLEDIQDFDWGRCKPEPQSRVIGRRSFQMLPDTYYGGDLATEQLAGLLDDLNDIEVLVDLSRETGHPEELLRKNFIGATLTIAIDSAEYNLARHTDASPTLQIYLGPDGATGTQFYDPIGVMTEVPFVTNTGYFQIPSKGYTHGVKNTVPGRKSIIVFWRMLNTFYQLLPSNTLLMRSRV